MISPTDQTNPAVELEEIDRQLSQALASKPYLAYHPNPAQLRLHKSLAFERWLFGGNGLGKDAAMVNEFGWHCLGEYPAWYPESCKINPQARAIAARYCCTTFNDGIKQIVLPEFKKWFGGLCRYLVKDNAMVFPKTGSIIYFKTYDQETDSYAGANLHLVGQSEHCPRDKYDENMARLRGSGVRRFIGEMTPTEGMTWEFDDIFEVFEMGKRVSPDLDVLRGCTADNISNLSERYVAHFEKMDDKSRRIRLYGDFIAMTGLVYSMYRDWPYEEIREGDRFGGHLVKPFDIPRHWPRSMCIDPHTRKPFAILWRAISPDGNRYYYDEFKPDLAAGEKLLVRDYADVIKKKEGNLHDQISYRLIDTSARVQDPITGIDIQQALAAPPLRIVTRVVKKFEKKVDNGIKKVQEGFNFTEIPLRPNKYAPGIFIFDTLANLRYELRHYVWDEYARKPENYDVKDKPKKKYDDLLDCMKYLEQSGGAYEAYEVGKLSGVRGNPYMR